MNTQTDLPDAFVPTIRNARMDDVDAVLLLQREAFADKFGAAFGARHIEDGIAAMAEAWRRQGVRALRGMYVACDGRQVIGTTTLRTWEMGGDDTGTLERAFHDILGLWGTLRSTFALSIIDHRIGREEGYISDVAVLPTHRRRGVAHALLDYAEREARLLRKRYLGLYVSGASSHAQNLYRQHGFTVGRTRHSVTAALILRQPRWLYMIKSL